MLVGLSLMAQAHQPRSQQMREQRMPEDRPKPEMSRMQHDRGLGMLERVNLNEQQREQIRNFQHNHRLERIDLQAEVTKLRLQVQQALQNNEFREAKRLNDQLYLKEGELAKKGIELREKIYQVLTPEQREQMKQMPPARSMGGD